MSKLGDPDILGTYGKGCRVCLAEHAGKPDVWATVIGNYAATTGVVVVEIEDTKARTERDGHTPLSAIRRWTRTGRQLAYDGVPALHIDRLLDNSGNAPLSPVQADAIADRICDHLNAIDLGALTRIWIRKPKRKP